MTPLAAALTRWLASSGGELGECRRLFHGRGGCDLGWEHVVVDWFPPVLLVTLYAPWEEGETFLQSLCNDALPNIWLQHRYLSGAPTTQIRGEIPDPLLAQEAGLRFQLNLRGNQNHGFFLDMRPGREWLRERAAGKKILNLFSYTCAFSVVAIAAGAEQVVNVDMAKGALTTGRLNHRLNGEDAEVKKRVRFLPHDVFKSWGKLRRFGPYDLILIDPPSFQPGGFVAAKDYPRVIRQLPRLVSETGTEILACLNAPELSDQFLLDIFAAELPQAVSKERLPPHPDFPDREPQRSLKAQVWSVNFPRTVVESDRGGP